MEQTAKRWRTIGCSADRTLRAFQLTQQVVFFGPRPTLISRLLANTQLPAGKARGVRCLRLRWDHIDWTRKHFVVHDTKNKTDHYIPLSRLITGTLKRQQEYLGRIGKEDSPWVFPAARGDEHMTEPKSQLKKVTDVTGIKFSFHDLRRTFATHAVANGVTFDLIRRALNHKSRSVTEGYIITQIDTLRPVFDAVADGYHRYFDPDWEHEEAVAGAEGDEPLVT